MDRDSTSQSTLRDLASEIGQVQIYWCFLENEMRFQLDAKGMLEKAARVPVIVHWRTYLRRFKSRSNCSSVANYLEALEKVAKRRNLLAHCIQSASAMESESAFVVCVGPDGSEHKLTLDMIRKLSEEIDRTRRWTRNIITPD
jgi:hypothetical protein